jgi:hypothetical protein
MMNPMTWTMLMFGSWAIMPFIPSVKRYWQARREANQGHVPIPVSVAIAIPICYFGTIVGFMATLFTIGLWIDLHAV